MLLVKEKEKEWLPARHSLVNPFPTDFGCCNVKT